MPIRLRAVCRPVALCDQFAYFLVAAPLALLALDGAEPDNPALGALFRRGPAAPEALAHCALVNLSRKFL